MLKFTIVVMFLCVMILTYPARGDNLSWTNPTTRGNGTPYNAATDQANAKIYADGIAVATAPGAATGWASVADGL